MSSSVLHLGRETEPIQGASAIYFARVMRRLIRRCVRVVRALPTRGPMQRVVACTVTMCDDVNVYYLDQWRSSDSSTDVNIMIHNFREGHMTLLTHALHRAPSVSLETWSGELQCLFDRAVTRRCWTQHATTIVNNDIAREDAARFRHETAARWCARC